MNENRITRAEAYLRLAIMHVLEEKLSPPFTLEISNAELEDRIAKFESLNMETLEAHIFHKVIADIEELRNRIFTSAMQRRALIKKLSS